MHMLTSASVVLCFQFVAGCFGFTLDCSMSASSNDHLRQADDRPGDTNDIFSTLSPRQLNVLYGVLTNNFRTVFMDQLQDVVVANADSIVRGGLPRKAMPKVMPKITLRPRGPSTAPTPYRPPRNSIGYFCDTTAATTTSTEEPSEF